MSTLRPILALAAVLALTPTVQAQQGYPARLDLGTAITPQELAQFFSIPADGRGLPPGKGTYADGEKLVPCVTATSCRASRPRASAATS
jgi:cytochrome c